MPKLETRRMAIRLCKDEEKRMVSGVAVPYNSASHPIPGSARTFREVMAPGALTYDEYTVMLVQHDQDGVPLARVGAGTLRFRESPDGLQFEADLPDSREDIHEALRRGDLDGSVSVGMYVDDDEWTHGSDSSMRKVTRGRLIELSLVTAGAYEGARGEYGGGRDG